MLLYRKLHTAWDNRTLVNLLPADRKWAGSPPRRHLRLWGVVAESWDRGRQDPQDRLAGHLVDHPQHLYRRSPVRVQSRVRLQDIVL